MSEILKLYVRGDYAIWQFPLFGLLLIGWLVGGGWLLLWRLRQSDLAKRRVSFGRCVLAVFLAGAGWLLAAAALFQLIRALEPMLSATVSVKWIGLFVGGVLGMPMFYLVIFAMFELPLKAVVAKASPAMVGLVGLTTAVGAGVYVPVRYIQAGQVATLNARRNLNTIHLTIANEFERGAIGRPPRSLDKLVENSDLTTDDVRNPRDPGREIGFFYFPTPTKSGERSERLRAAEFPHAGTEEERLVLFADGTILSVAEAEFQRLLGLPENEDFAEAYRSEVGSK